MQISEKGKLKVGVVCFWPRRGPGAAAVEERSSREAALSVFPSTAHCSRASGLRCSLKGTSTGGLGSCHSSHPLRAGSDGPEATCEEDAERWQFPLAGPLRLAAPAALRPGLPPDPNPHPSLSRHGCLPRCR